MKKRIVFYLQTLVWHINILFSILMGIGMIILMVIFGSVLSPFLYPLYMAIIIGYIWMCYDMHFNIEYKQIKKETD